MKLRWVLVVLVVLITAVGGGYWWLQYGGEVIAEGRVQLRVTRAGAGDPQLRADYVSGVLSGPGPTITSSMAIERKQAPSGVVKGDVLDCAYVQRVAPIVNRNREPVITDCQRVAG